MKTTISLTPEMEIEICHNFLYDRVSGLVVYKLAPNRKPFLLGKPAGTLQNTGYLSVKVCGRTFLLHRIIWFLETGEWPEEIDHDNRIRNDNRWLNLKESNRWKNSQNLSKEGCTSSVVGVCYWGNGKWNAYLRGKSLGYFNSEAEAGKARQIAEAQNGVS